MMKITAAIAREPGQDFSIEACELGEPGPGEVLVKVESCGICHTDIAARNQDMPVPLPAVLGHEGVGCIEKLGEGVSDYQVGDRVLMSFGSCGQCGNCNTGAPGYCDNGLAYFVGMRLDGSSPVSQNGKPMTGHFFAQSSFANYCVASTVNLVKLDDSLPAELMAPLACGVQTGMGAVLLAMKAQANKSLVVIGCGTVGLAAIIAGKIAGCDPIIAVDLMESRLELASELGATHIINGAEGNLTEQLLALGGANYVLDTTGVPQVISSAIDGMKKQGHMVLVGVGKPETKLNFDMNMFMMTGKKLEGVIEGNAVPAEFVPQMIEYYRNGQLPLEKLVTSYPFTAINQAVADMHSGKAVKAVLKMA
ncbi:NAD(P)-dependent alcohol dehydrogenase [Spongiibacter sp. KMU-158]|uniref:NAD(P)-dependent alcohol dehydrogenase n=1 Tax=Spongiibacter pelagi TaxID=2760804 RepID=A0A927C0C7_9GAMM|nr:NAD(P)-dependent alcohol dehydrogenase [Spongiibacter pelagi]MBD2858915.1 NAD(P)-dependent alcohol dehydrogenase [Spongiibacter pelagi]